MLAPQFIFAGAAGLGLEAAAFIEATADTVAAGVAANIAKHKLAPKPSCSLGTAAAVPLP